MTPPQILLSAGEASGDMYAARLAVALRERTGGQFFGMGGERMKEAGVEIIADYHEIAVVGLAEVLHKIPAVIRVQRLLAREAVRRHASLAILIDSPGTHLGVARRLKNAGIPVGYFIGPQVWAWRAGRVKTIRRLVKHIAVIFPFEEKIYRDAGVPADFVGHPLVDVVKPEVPRAEFAAAHGLDVSRPILAILPGSRKNEIAQNYATIIEACTRLARTTKAQFVLVAAPGLSTEFFSRHARPDFPITHVEGNTYSALAAADCAIVASGTATLEAALLGTPMVVVYRVSAASALVLRRMIHTPFFSLVNLVGGREIVPELIQEDFTPSEVESAVRRLLDSPDARREMKAGLREVRNKLGTGGAIERAADIFARMV
ncbi:MAG TPA: lipid-A-disaccharide synthase [Candidatus Acidoferrales bacterium]|jgi:lipid-A-disaccharide synthase